MGGITAFLRIMVIIFLLIIAIIPCLFWTLNRLRKFILIELKAFPGFIIKLLGRAFFWIWEHWHLLAKYILLTIFIFVCTKFVDGLITKFFIETIFKEVVGSYFLDLGMIGYLVFCFIAFYHWFNKKYIVSEEYIFFHSFLILWYFFFRANSSLSFEFVMIYYKPLRPYIAYFDILFAFPAIWMYILFYLQKRSEAKEIGGVTVTGSQLFSEDFLDATDIESGHSLFDIKENTNANREYAKDLCAKIYSVDSANSFAVAILGQWGAGKSHFLSLIKQEFTNDYYGERIELIEFSPWKNKGEEAIIKDFFALLSQRLTPYNGNVRPQINDYLGVLLGSGKKWETRLLRLILLGGLMPKNTEDEYKKLGKAIAEIEKRVVIIIDDLDRLDGEEILGVLKLIRNIANFENLIFVAAYDRKYVNRAIESSLHEFDCNSFLEKIFQLEVSLPVFDPQGLSNILISLLEYKFPNILNIEGNENVRKQILENEEGIIWRYLSNVRDLIRFVNLLILDIENTIQEVNAQEIWDIAFCDFIWSRLLKLKFPTCYLFLYEKRYVIYDLDESGHYFSLKKSAETMVLREKGFYYEELMKEYKLVSSDSYQIVSDTIKLLFKFKDERNIYINNELEKFSEKNQLGFSNTWTFYKYFSNKAFIGKPSKNKIIDLFDLKSSKITTQLNDWSQSKDNIRRVHNLLLGIDLTVYFVSKNDYEKIIKHLAPTAIVEKNKDRRELIVYYLLREDITIHFYQNNVLGHKNFIKSLFESSKLTLISLSELIKEGEEFKVFSNQEFKKLYTLLIIKGLESEGDMVSVNHLRRLEQMLNHELIDKTSTSIKKALKKVIKEHFDEFLKTLVTFTGGDFRVKLKLQIVDFVFGNMSAFKKFYQKEFLNQNFRPSLIQEIFFDILLEKWLNRKRKDKVIHSWAASAFNRRTNSYPIYIYFTKGKIEEKEAVNILFSNKGNIMFPISPLELKINGWRGEDNDMEEVCYLAIPVGQDEPKIGVYYQFRDESAPSPNSEDYVVNPNIKVNLNGLGFSDLRKYSMPYKVYCFDLLNGSFEILINVDKIKNNIKRASF